jgi:hypothetical protein
MAMTKTIELRTAIPGPRSQAILERKERVIANAKSIVLPIVAYEGRGATITDVDGNVFLDFTGGVGCLNTGHAHPRVVEAATEQLARFAHTDFTVVPYEPYVELAANPRAALLFHWQPLGRQVRVEGSVAPVSRDEADAYFRSRPLGSRVAAASSPQSRPLADRAELERLVAAARSRFPGEEVPLPDHWGGFRVVPDAYEFWQHGEDRLHDRVRYERAGAAWTQTRLAP